MVMEPITLFAATVDPAAVARKLRELSPTVAIDGPDDNWRNAVVTFAKGNQKQTLTFTHDPAYYAEPNWSTQMSGMRGYFSGFPDTDRKPQAMALISSFRFSLGTLFEPDYDPEDDPRLDIVFAVAEVLDGALFTPSSLRDANGRILFGAEGEDEGDPDAVWPRGIDEDDDDEDASDADEDEEDVKETTRRRLTVDCKWLALAVAGTIVLGLVCPRRPIYVPSLNLEWLVAYVGVGLLFGVYFWAKALVAWRFGMRPSLIEVGGLSPTMITFHVRGAECRFLALPFVGELEFATDDDDDEPVSLDELPYWKKVVFRLAGPVAMFLAGFLILASSYVLGRSEPKFLHEPARIGWCRPGSDLARAGLQRGDEVVAASYDGTSVPINDWRDLIHVLLQASGRELTLEVRAARRPSPSMPRPRPRPSLTSRTR